jgi:hypothetical protein
MGALNIIITSLLVIGLILIFTDVVKTYHRCPPKTVEYKFVPSSFRE